MARVDLTTRQVIDTVDVGRDPRAMTLSPSGDHALVPHLLHNLNHDVNHNFGGTIDGDFANRVYPALTVLDRAQMSYAQPGDASKRLHHEISDFEQDYAEYVPFGPQGRNLSGGIAPCAGIAARDEILGDNPHAWSGSTFAGTPAGCSDG